MTFEKAIKILITKLGEARRDKMIQKPLAWALYQTWEIADEKEKARNIE